jgi:hypothetical protein
MVELWWKGYVNMLLYGVPYGQALRSYCTGLSRRAGIRFNPLGLLCKILSKVAIHNDYITLH